MELKEFAIIETFRGLDADRQRSVLEKLLMETKLTSVTIKFKNEDEKRMYEFAKKQWPLMSTDFFNRFMERWETLCDKSYGNDNISCCDIGDLYLQAKSWGTDDYSCFPFDNNFYKKIEFFYREVPEECSWEYMFISVLKYEDNSITNYVVNYPIKDLMELSEEKYVAKMKEFDYF